MDKRLTVIGFVLMLVLTLKAMGDVTPCSIGEADCGYCGNPYLLGEGYWQNYCRDNAITMESCCPDTSDPEVPNDVYDSADPYKPDSQNHCETDFYSQSSVDSINPHCDFGCCRTEEIGQACIGSTEYSCLEDPTSSGVEWDPGFNNPLNPCQSPDDPDTWVFGECTEPESTECGDYGDQTICTDAGCSWCETEGNEDCIANCKSCPGKEISLQGVCTEKQSGCATWDDNQAECIQNGCYYCPVPVSGEHYCVDSCDIGCSDYPYERDNDGVCDEPATCSDYNSDKDDCNSLDECKWCPDSTCVSFSQGVCQDCDWNIALPQEDECVDECHNNLDDDSDGDEDTTDLCCIDCLGGGDACAENQDCILWCERGKPIYDSSMTSIDGDSYCKCGTYYTSDEVPVHNVFERDSVALDRYCCDVEGSYVVMDGSCISGHYWACLYDEDTDEPIGCKTPQMSSSNCSVTITSGYGNDYVVSGDDWDRHSSKNCFRILNLPGGTYTADVSYTAAPRYSPTTVEGISITNNNGNNPQQPDPIYLEPFDVRCWDVTVDVAARPYPCEENSTRVEWNVTSNYDGSDCMEIVQSVTITSSDAGFTTSQSGIIARGFTRLDEEDGFSLEFGDTTDIDYTFELNYPTGHPDGSETVSGTVNDFMSGEVECKTEQGYHCDGVPFCDDPRNNALTCNSRNRLTYTEECTGDLFCYMNEGVGMCMEPSECRAYSLDTNFFGMDPVPDGAETCFMRDGERKYCYMDYSDTTVDACMQCETTTACYDYKSEFACQDPEYGDYCNNQLDGYSNCSWYSSPQNFEDLGVGFCFSPAYNRTDHCSKCGPGGEMFKNVNCEQAVCDILGACYTSDVGHTECLECVGPSEEVPTSCYDLVDRHSCIQSNGDTDDGERAFSIEGEHCVPELGFKCNYEDGFLYSYDACNIGRCKWNEQESRCYRDSNDDGAEDCATEDEICKRDSFPGHSRVVAQAPPLVITKDVETTFEIEVSHPKEQATASQLYYCISEDNCFPTRTAGEPTARNGRIETFQFSFYGRDLIDDYSGPANLSFFSVDEYGNTEPIRSWPVFVDTKLPDIDLDIVKYKFDDINMSKLNITVTTDEYVNPCKLCISKNVSAITYEKCLQAEGYNILDETDPRALIDPDDPGRNSSHLVVKEYEYLEDSLYTLATECTDIYGNLYSNYTYILIDYFKRIKQQYPIGMNRYASNDIASGELMIGMMTEFERLKCFYEDYTAYPGSSWLHFTDSQVTRVDPPDGPTPDTSSHHYDAEVVPSRDPDAIDSQYYRLHLTCMNLTCSDPASEPDCRVDTVAVDFVVDTIPPNSRLQYISSYGNPQEWSDVQDGMVFNDFDMRVLCDDRQGTDFEHIGPFGCSNVSYCYVQGTGQACEPNTTVDYGSEEGDHNSTFAITESDIGLANMDESFTICITSKDFGENTEPVSCTDVQVDSEPPEFTLSHPLNNSVFPPRAFESSALLVEGSWSDNLAEQVSILLAWWNMTPNTRNFTQFTSTGSLNLDRYEGMFTNYIVPYLGKNILKVSMWELGLIGGSNYNTKYYNIFWDTVGPEFHEVEVHGHHPDGSIVDIKDLNDFSEYGEHIIFNITVNDTYWLGGNISAVMIKLKCGAGYCQRHKPYVHEFWVDSINSSQWDFEIDPGDATYFNGSGRVLPGYYNVTIIAWDGFYPIPDQPPTDLKAYLDHYNNNQSYRTRILINDTSASEVNISLYVPHHGFETGLPIMSHNYQESALIDVSCSEPIKIRDGELNYQLRDESSCRGVIERNAEPDAGNRTHHYIITLSNSPCFDELQDRGSEPGNNTELMITYRDMLGNVATSGSINQYRYFEIDTLAPNQPYPFYTNSFTSEGDAYMTGFITKNSELGFNISDYNVTVYMNQSQGGEQEQVMQSVVSKLLGQESAVFSAAEGETGIRVSSTEADCSDTDYIDVGTYLKFEEHDREYLRFYEVTAIGECEGFSYREVSIDPGLAEAVQAEEEIKVYDNHAPHGWFQFYVELAEGNNSFFLTPVDEMDNQGNTTQVDIISDNTDPTITIIRPRNATITGETGTTVDAILSDTSSVLSVAGINMSSIWLNLSEYNYSFEDQQMLGLYSQEHYTCDDQGPLYCDTADGVVVNISLELPGNFSNNHYEVTLYAEDIVGNSVRADWFFKINDAVPTDPTLDLSTGHPFSFPDIGGRLHEMWYLDRADAEFYLIFDAENYYVEVTNITLVGNDSVSVYWERLNSLAFRGYFSEELAEGQHDLMITARRYIGEEGLEEFTGVDGMYAKSFTVDLTDPIINATDIPDRSSRLDVPVKGTVIEKYLDEIVIGGEGVDGAFTIPGSAVPGEEFSTQINLTEGSSGYREVILTATDKSGRSSQSVTEAYIDTTVLAPVLEEIRDPHRHTEFNITGYSPDLDIQEIKAIIGYSDTGLSATVGEYPEGMHEIEVDQDFCNGNQEYDSTMPLNKEVVISDEGIFALELRVRDPDGAFIFDSMLNEGESFSFMLDTPGEYTYDTIAQGGCVQSGTIVADPELNHRFTIEVPRGEVTENQYNNIYVSIEDLLGNINFSEQQDVFFDSLQGTLTDLDPEPGSNHNLEQISVGFTVSDNHALNTSSIWYSVENSTDRIEFTLQSAEVEQGCIWEGDRCISYSARSPAIKVVNNQSYWISVGFRDLAGNEFIGPSTQWQVMIDNSTPLPPSFVFDGTTHEDGYYFGEAYPDIEVQFPQRVELVSAAIVQYSDITLAEEIARTELDVGEDIVERYGDERRFFLNESVEYSIDEPYRLSVDAILAGSGEYNIGGPYYSRYFYMDNTEPGVIFTNDGNLNNTPISIEGEVDHETYDSMRVNPPPMVAEHPTQRDASGTVDEQLGFTVPLSSGNLEEGGNTFNVTAHDKAGNTGSGDWNFNYDSTLPEMPLVQVLVPEGSWDGQYYYADENPVRVNITVYEDDLRVIMDRPGQPEVTLNSDQDSGNQVYAVNVVSGTNRINFSVRDLAGNVQDRFNTDYDNGISTVMIVYDGSGPKFRDPHPAQGSRIGSEHPEILDVVSYSSYGRIDEATATMRINSYPVDEDDIGKRRNNDGSYTLYLRNPSSFGNWRVYRGSGTDGNNIVQVGIEDFAGTYNQTTWNFVLDKTAPLLIDSYPSKDTIEHITDTMPILWVEYDNLTRIASASLTREGRNENLLEGDFYTRDNRMFWYATDDTESWTQTDYRFTVRAPMEWFSSQQSSTYLEFNAGMEGPCTSVVYDIPNNQTISSTCSAEGNRVRVSPDGGFDANIHYNVTITATAPTFASLEHITYQNSVRVEKGIKASIEGNQIYYYGSDEEGLEYDYYPRPSPELTDGKYNLNIRAYLLGIEGGMSDDTITFVVDTQEPEIGINHPDPLYTNSMAVDAGGSWDDLPNGCDTLDSIRLTSDPRGTECIPDIQLGTRSYSCHGIGLFPDENTLAAYIRDKAGHQSSANITVFVDNNTPAITLSPPLPQWHQPKNYISNTSEIDLEVLISREGNVKLWKGSQILTDQDYPGDFVYTVSLTRGDNLMMGNLTDIFGNVGSDMIHVQYDDAEPEIEIVYPQDGQAVGTPYITISAMLTDQGSAIDDIQLLINGESYDRWSFEDSILSFQCLDELSDGENQVELIVRDEAGNPSSASWSFVVDRSIPVFVGFSSPPLYTNDSTPYIEFSYNSRVNLQSVLIDSSDITGLMQSTDEQRFYHDYTEALSEGRHELSVSAEHIDRPGPLSEEYLGFTVDTVPPSISITEPDRQMLPSCSFELSGTWDEDRELDSITYYFEDGAPEDIGLIDDMSDPKTFRADVEIPRPYEEYIISTAIRDLAGNMMVDSRAVQCDPDPPMITIDADRITRVEEIELEGHVSEAAEIEVFVDEDTNSLGEQDGSFTGSITLVPGINRIHAVATDNAGHTGESNTLEVMYDNQAPEIIDFTPADGSVTGNRNARITVHMLDQGSGIDPESIELKINNIIRPGWDLENDTLAYRCNGNELITGENIISFRVEDSAGNRATVQWSFTVDDSVPGFIELYSPDRYTSNRTPMIGFRYDNSTVLTSVTLTGLGDITDRFVTEDHLDFRHHLSEELSQDDYTIEMRGQLLLNQGPESIDTGYFTVDLTPPTVSISEDVPYFTDSITVDVYGGFSDEVGIDRVTVKVNDGLERDAGTIDTIRDEYRHEARLTREENLITVTAYDLAGNTAQATRTINLDSSIPLIEITEVSESITEAPGRYRTGEEMVRVSGYYVEDYLDSIYLADDPSILAETEDGEFSIVVPLEGMQNTETLNEVRIMISDRGGATNYDEAVIIKDNLGPGITLTQPANQVTSDRYPTVAVSTNEETEECILKYVDADSNPVTQEMEALSTTSHRATLTNPLADRTYNEIDFYCTDRVGNTGKEKYLIDVDLETPVIEDIYLYYADRNQMNANEAHFLLFREETMLEVTADEPVICKFGEGQSYPDMIPFPDHSSRIYRATTTSATFALEDQQSHTRYIDCEDEAGNRLESAFIAEIDVNTLAGIQIKDISPIGYTNENNPEFTFQTYRAAECTVSYDRDGDRDYDSSETATASEGEHYWNYSIIASDIDETLTNLINSRSYSFRIRCTDADGIRNPGEEEFRIIYDDIFYPMPVIHSPEDGFYHTGDGRIGLVGEAEANSTIQLYVNGVKQGQELNNPDQVFEIAQVLLDEGDNVLRIDATDRAGNDASAQVTGRYSNQGPVVDAIVPLPGTIAPHIDNVTAYLRDPEGVGLIFDENSIIVRDSSNDIRTGELVVHGNTTLLMLPDSDFNEEEYYITVSVRDTKGRVAHGYSDFRIVEGIPYMTLSRPSQWAGIVTTKAHQQFIGEAHTEGKFLVSKMNMEGVETDLCEEGEDCDYDGYIYIDTNQSLRIEGLNSYYFWLQNDIALTRYSKYPGEITKDTTGPDFMDIKVKGAKEFEAATLGDLTGAPDRGEMYVDFTNISAPEIVVTFNEEVIITSTKLFNTAVPQEIIPTTMTENRGGSRYTFRPETEIADGEYVFSVNCTDIYQNSMIYTPNTGTFVIDTIPPDISITEPISKVVRDENVQMKIEGTEEVMLTEAFAGDVNLLPKFPQQRYIEQYLEVVRLEDGEYNLSFKAEDRAGNVGADSKEMVVITEPLKIKLVEPPYSVVNELPYTVTVETNRRVSQGSCRYSIDEAKDHEEMDAMTSIDDFTHEIPRIHREADVYISCIDIYNISNKAVFQIVFDDTPPVITSKTVYPPVVTETPQVKFTVVTNEPTRCRYWDNNEKEHKFPGWDNGTFKATNEVTCQTPTHDGKYTYYVICYDRAYPRGRYGNPSKQEAMTFEVDLGGILAIEDNTKEFFREDPYLNFSTNKRAECLFGNSSTNKKKNPIMSSNKVDFSVDLDIDEDGKYVFYAYCYSILRPEQDDDVRIAFTLDNSEPSMVSAEIYEPDLKNNYTWRTDKVYGKWKGEDNESGISEYEIELWKDELANETLVSSETTDKDRGWISGLLHDAKTYFIKVWAVNGAGIKSESMESNRLTVDTSLKPIPPPPDPYKPPGWSCSDGNKNGYETDVDCGGQTCPPCSNGKNCLVDSDCESGVCDNVTGKCVDNYVCDRLEDLDCDRIFNYEDDDIDGDEIVNWEDPDDDDDQVCDTLISPLNDESCSGQDDDDDQDYRIDPEDKDQDNDLDNDGGKNNLQSDMDGDGLDNNQDPDDDNDGLCDTFTSPLNDESCDEQDDDDDNDGILDTNETDSDDDHDNDGMKNNHDDDIDGDGLMNWEDPDDDNDGLCDTLESPLNDPDVCAGEDNDDDGDGLEDQSDIDEDSDLDNDGTENCMDDDMDGDGIENSLDPDDDNDGIPDESDQDIDNNGIPNDLEDCDGDELPDVWERMHGLDPRNSADADADSDGDGLSNKEEYDLKDSKWGGSTDPHKKDTDGDGYDDGKEVEEDTDPLDRNDHPVSLLWLILLLLLILIILVVGSYFGYQKYKVMVNRRPPPPVLFKIKGMLGKVGLGDLIKIPEQGQQYNVMQGQRPQVRQPLRQGAGQQQQRNMQAMPTSGQQQRTQNPIRNFMTTARDKVFHRKPGMPVEGQDTQSPPVAQQPEQPQRTRVVPAVAGEEKKDTEVKRAIDKIVEEGSGKTEKSDEWLTMDALRHKTLYGYPEIDKLSEDERSVLESLSPEQLKKILANKDVNQVKEEIKRINNINNRYDGLLKSWEGRTIDENEIKNLTKQDPFDSLKLKAIARYININKLSPQQLRILKNLTSEEIKALLGGRSETEMKRRLERLSQAASVREIKRLDPEIMAKVEGAGSEGIFSKIESLRKKKPETSKTGELAKHLRHVKKVKNVNTEKLNKALEGLRKEGSLSQKNHIDLLKALVKEKKIAPKDAKDNIKYLSKKKLISKPHADSSIKKLSKIRK